MRRLFATPGVQQQQQHLQGVSAASPGTLSSCRATASCPSIVKPCSPQHVLTPAWGPHPLSSAIRAPTPFSAPCHHRRHRMLTPTAAAAHTSSHPQPASPIPTAATAAASHPSTTSSSNNHARLGARMATNATPLAFQSAAMPSRDPSLQQTAQTQPPPRFKGKVSGDTWDNIQDLPPLQAPNTGGWRLPPTAPLTWGFMITYLVFMLIVPIVALLVKASQTPLQTFVSRAFEPVALHAYFVSFSCASAAAAINAVFGFILAWVLVKYDFPCKKWIDAAVDLPFALPTSVAGLTLATVYSDETFLGQFLDSIGMPVVFTRLGVALAMVFVSFPFVVRTMQPVIQEMQPELEEAAWTLGASPWKTFTEVLMPPLLPPLLTGTALAFSRALGEFGSIVILSSNFAFKDLIAPVLIFQCLEQYDFTGATIIGTVLLGISLCIMLLVNWIQTLGAKFKNN